MRFNLHKLTLVSIIAAISAVGRIAFQFIPNFQPTTAIIIIASYFLGPLSGVLLAIVSTYLSNLVLGIGLWSIWQMFAWAMISLLSSLLKKINLKKTLPILIIIGVFAGFFYGAVFAFVNLLITNKFWPYYLAGLTFDLNHAISNVIFIVILYKPMTRLFANISIL
ncbi:ECF transporter S component [Amphibacillus cookii]|uniref:ECF transporter S component n=1 Tax=Amphibacillus cookii TaxID=767787 RepID=UPI001956B2ED|nr:ECF transporter S component [Amphibacillus cookii]MBM7542489.1 energy-coupling factor transport system substrate-specific component [Amphibacillus cookii]